MIEQIIQISKDLISIQSDPNRTDDLNKALDYVKDLLKDFTIEEFKRNNSSSILVYSGTKRPDKFELILNGHLDVIPGKKDQYKPYIKEGRLYGVGAMDMKSNLVCAILAFKELAKSTSKPIGLQIVTDEEIGGFDGTKYQVESGVNANFVIATEPTNFNIVTKSKGVLWLEIESHGQSAHGAYTWRGDNAIYKMNKFISEIYKVFPIPKKEIWAATVNVSQIETTNKSYNKVPSDCMVKLDVRFTEKEKDTILETIESLLPDGFEIKVIANEPMLYTPDDNKYVQIIKNSTQTIIRKDIKLYGANGSSDARHYSLVNTHGVEFGPIGGGIGEDIEWVDIDSLEKYHQILLDIIRSI